jgi:polyphosphate kinase 2 (PPK2 family)
MRLPKRGRITIFDDYSWYGRMLMEPIEGLCTEAEHIRAARQIRDFELMLAEEHYLLLKFWIQVSRDEQFKRFKRRLDNPYKSWKLTPEDWRNRQMYDFYIEHAQRMIKETHAPHAPWYVLPGDHKLLTRINVLNIVTDALRGYPVESAPYTQRFEQLHWLEEHGDEPLDD